MGATRPNRTYPSRISLAHRRPPRRRAKPALGNRFSRSGLHVASLHQRLQLPPEIPALRGGPRLGCPCRGPVRDRVKPSKPRKPFPDGRPILLGHGAGHPRGSTCHEAPRSTPLCPGPGIPCAGHALLQRRIDRRTRGAGCRTHTRTTSGTGVPKPLWNEHLRRHLTFSRRPRGSREPRLLDGSPVCRERGSRSDGDRLPRTEERAPRTRRSDHANAEGLAFAHPCYPVLASKLD